jgi:hypothetical protein
MIKYALINTNNGECTGFVNVQSATDYENGYVNSSGFMQLVVDKNTDETLYMSRKYYRDEEWHDRDACPGDHYVWRDYQWNYDNSEMWTSIKNQRNYLLLLSDWTQLPDSPLSEEKKTEWTTYRQGLRDLPASNSEAESEVDIEWPPQPS